MSAILSADPVPLARLAPQTTAEVQRIVRKCLEKDKSRRYQTLRDVATDLEALRRDSNTPLPLTAKEEHLEEGSRTQIGPIASMAVSKTWAWL